MATTFPTKSDGTTLVLTGATAEITKVDGFALEGMSREALDMTPMDSTNPYLEFEPVGFYDPGSLNIDMVFNGVAGATLITATANTVTIAFPGATPSTSTVSGFLTDFGITGARGGRIEASARLKLTGAALTTPA